VTTLHTDLGPDTVRLLTDACREADLVARLEDAQRDAPLTVRGSQGQEVASPLISEVRQHRAVLAGLLKALKLPQTAGDARRAEQEVSEKNRAAARARWDKPRLVSNG
jgi:hypothetical protein